MSDAVNISVVVPTRNRPDHAAECARRLVDCAGLEEVVFVDQSDDAETQLAIDKIGDPRIRCVPSDLRGATNGRNVGIAETSGRFIAFTDDDCRVSPGWLTEIRRIFDADADAAIVCGRVRVPDEIAAQGFAIGFDPVVREWVHEFPPPDRDWGITANLSARRETFDRIGTFDSMLGPGAYLRCGEEPDLLFRALRAGMKVVNASEVEVDHLGVRAFGQESSELFDMYGTGTGAALVKHVRLGDRAATVLYLRHLARSCRAVAAALVHRRRPLGLRYLLAFLDGTVRSFRFRVDRQRRMYAPRRTRAMSSS
jgi:glycosyltransferase involved in cell wall biosynthesis